MSERSCRRRRWLAGCVGLLMLAACGGGGESAPTYALAIDGPSQVSTVSAAIVLTGSGFLPSGSTCSDSGCGGLLPPPVFGSLGEHTLDWSNAATGESGPIMMSWVCNCGGSAPMWIRQIGLAVGANVITITERAGGRTEQAVVTVTRTPP